MYIQSCGYYYVYYNKSAAIATNSIRIKKEKSKESILLSKDTSKVPYQNWIYLEPRHQKRALLVDDRRQRSLIRYTRN